METICISLSGGIIFNGKDFNFSYMKKLAALLDKHKDKKFVIVTGGGPIARQCISAARKGVKNKFALDKIGILSSRINAIVLSEIVPNSIIVNDIDELKRFAPSSRIIMGGLLPGITTDSVTVLACEALGAKLLINISSVSYLYTAMPGSKNALKIKNTTFDRLIEIANREDKREPGTNFLFDIFASKLAQRSGIMLKFVDLRISELEKAISNRQHSGTVIKS